jgi:hypothetical protein
MVAIADPRWPHARFVRHHDRKDRRGPVDDGVELLADLITPDARAPRTHRA